MVTPAAARRQPAEIIDLAGSGTDDELEEAPGPAARPSHRLQHRQDAEPEPAPQPPEDSPVIPHLGPDFFGDLENLHGFDLHAAPGAFPEAELDETPPGADPPAMQQGQGQWVDIDGEPVFIPDSPEPRAQPQQQNQVAPQADQEAIFQLGAHVLTADDCVARVLEIFPDVKPEYVRELYGSLGTPGDFEGLAVNARYENIIDKLVTGDYPKQDKGKQLQKKRKREDDDPAAIDTKRWEGPDRMALPNHLKGSMVAMIKADFPTIPNMEIQKLLGTHKHFYQTYVEVANMRDTSDPNKIWRGRSTSKGATADTIGANSGSQVLLEELVAARKKVTAIRAERAAAEALKRAENENLQRAMEAGETAECQACFEDLPMNRQIHCNGGTAHFTCFDCAATYIKSEVGESRCRVLCTAGCGAGFAHAQLHLLSDKPLLARLEQLQQEKDIRDAGLDNLEECPFCEYKAILPPVEEDFEFRCANPDCEKISCRRCKAVSHIPLSCEEHAKDNKLNTRHKIEEAMTAALIRSCNKCKKQFIKEYGCNKMTCPSCANLQCYVCSESLKDYNHFDQQPAGPHRAGQTTGGKKKCPLYDNVEERHEREVKEAEAAARAAAKAENPDVTDDDLQIKVSDAVKNATADRINRAGPMGAHAGIAFPAFLHPAHRLLGNEAADLDEDGDDEADPFGIYGYGAADRRAARARRLGNAEMRLALQQRLQDAARRVPRPQARAPRAPPMAPPAPVGGFGHLGPLQGVIPVFAPAAAAAAHNDLDFYDFGGNDPLGQNAQPHRHALGGQHAAQHRPAGGAPGGHVDPPRPLGQLYNGRDAFLGGFYEDPFGDGNLDPFWPDFFLNNHNNGAAANNQTPRQRAQAQPNDEDDQIRQAGERQRLALQRIDEHLGGRQVRELTREDPRRRHEPRGWPRQPQG